MRARTTMVRHASEQQGQCFVFTYKDGALAKMAHDLRLSVAHFRIDLDKNALVAVFDATSLRVDCAMKHGQPNDGALSVVDKTKIERTIAADVLRTARFREVVVRMALPLDDEAQLDSGFACTVVGQLSLCGQTKDQEITLTLDATQACARATVHQPRFGITPFTALFGALKIKPDVDIALSLRRPLPR
jgi:YceI-like domain